MSIIYTKNKNLYRKNTTWDSTFNNIEAESVNSFHKTIPGYSITPLYSLNNLAKKYNVKKIFIKDESPRFGLNAFKGLGGSYCIANYIAKKFDLDIHITAFSDLLKYKNNLSDTTFITATDGNHGRGIAWMANMLCCKSKVLMPKGTISERLTNIQKLGADAEITELNYDDTVRYAHNLANEHNWPFMQDTVVGSESSNAIAVMQGYLTIGNEIKNAITDTPTHIFLQAGVGSTAAALCAYFRNIYSNEPIISIVEAQNCECIYKTALANDGELKTVTGDLKTIMAGLSCGEINPIAWDIFNDKADYFFVISDDITENGMRILGKPISNDPKIISGESGAAGFGLAVSLFEKPEYKSILNELNINQNSVILCISTEGATDQKNYDKILNS